MKRRFITTLIIVVLSMFMLVGCTSTKNGIETKRDNKTKIVTSFYPMYILTSNITKDIENIEVINLTKPNTGCLHDYSISTNEMKILEDSDIFVINGANMEAFMDKVIKQMPNLKIIEASQGIQLLENSCNEKHNDDKEHEVNPHVWLSISKAIEQVKNIEKMLCEYDPSNKEEYEKNAN
ncbi:MAG: metal ABC transporter substrate-binding protein, partial [Romboutsia sp.]|uniref:metal ABC transporter substrate-binding protein n=1 Tax=Romboutsia sp. TaxID=1965302 RepID=UPI003F35FEAE